MLFKAIMSRLLFFGHGIACCYLFNKEQTSQYYWFLVAPLVFLFIESCVTCVKRSGREYKYIWPSGFFYITTIMPIIWFIELELSESKESSFDQQTALKTVGLEYDKKTDKEKSDIQRQILLNAIDAASAESLQLLKKICELGLMICIVIARWLMPRGSLSKDQLSALLLVYVGNSADILELFDTFEEPELVNEPKVLIAVLIVFTWSIYQFTLVTTATVNHQQTTVEQPQNIITDAYGRKVSINSQNIRKASINSGYESEESLANGRYSGRKMSTINQDPFGSRARRNSIVSNSDSLQGERRISVARKISIEGFGRGRKVSMAPSSLTCTELKNNEELRAGYVDNIRSHSRKMSTSSGYEKQRGRGKKMQAMPELPEAVAVNEEAGEKNETEITKRKLHGELYQILVTLMMQDGPFLILRLYLIIRLHVTSEMHIFFTCKNAIVSLLLIYRLLILSCNGHDEDEDFTREEAATKLHNIQTAMRMEELGPLAKIAVK